MSDSEPALLGTAILVVELLDVWGSRKCADSRSTCQNYTNNCNISPNFNFDVSNQKSDLESFKNPWFTDYFCVRKPGKSLSS